MAEVVQIVVTPRSGNGRGLSVAQRLQTALNCRGYHAEVRSFSDLDGLVQWTETCVPTFSFLVAVGGDSTIEAAAGAAIRLNTPLVPVPNGFGNLFARAFGHSKAPERVVELFEGGEVHRVDVGARNHRQMFLTYQSYGMLEEIEPAVEGAGVRPRSRLLRYLAYCAAASRFLLTAPLPVVRVEVEGSLLCQNAAVVAVANVETYGGYLNLTPGASPLDGCFDVAVIPGTTRASVWLGLFTVLLGLPGRWDRTVRCRGRRVRVTVGTGAPDELTVRHGVLPVLVAPGSMARLWARHAGTNCPVYLPALAGAAEERDAA